MVCFFLSDGLKNFTMIAQEMANVIIALCGMNSMNPASLTLTGPKVAPF